MVEYSVELVVQIELKEPSVVRAALQALSLAEQRKNRDRPYSSECRVALLAARESVLGLFKDGNPVEKLPSEEQLMAVAKSRRVLKAILADEAVIATVAEGLEELYRHCERWCGLDFDRRRIDQVEDIADLVKLHKLLAGSGADKHPDAFAREVLKWVDGAGTA